MVYVKVNVEWSRMGNWMLSYASAISQCPDEPVTFVLVGKSAAVDHDPRRCSELWPDAQYVECEAKDCASCGKCIPVDWSCSSLNADVVRRRFCCPERVRKRIVERFGAVLDNAVSIGVRRGDYLYLPHTHPFVGVGYLRRGVRKFPKGTTFIVNSDDFPWCRRFFTERRFPGMRFLFADGEDSLTDLFVPTFCQHNIIGNSTFLWWGAYLNSRKGKRVIYPSRWLGFADWGRKGRYDHARETMFFEGCEICKNSFSVALCLQAVVAWVGYSFVAWARGRLPCSERLWSFLLRFRKPL